MVKFTTSDNVTWRKNIGDVPKQWIDYGLDHRDSIEKYLYDNLKVYDADSAGDITVDFLFEDNTAYRLSYGWYCNISGDIDVWGEEPWIIDEYDIESIDPAEANVLTSSITRDWI